MKECWINVYCFPNGATSYGLNQFDLETAKRVSKQAIANGCKLLYRIHVKFKS